MPPGSTILEVQAETGLEELAGEEEDDAFDVETMNALKQYASKVRTQRFFHGLPAALRGWCSSPRLVWGLNVFPALVYLCICFSAMTALRRETGQGSCESATTERWLTVKDLEWGSLGAGCTTLNLLQAQVWEEQRAAVIQLGFFSLL